MSENNTKKELFRIYLKQQKELYGDQFWSCRSEKDLPGGKTQAYARPKSSGTSGKSSGKPVQQLKEQPIFMGDDNAELRQYYHEIKDCMACDLGKTRTNFVFGAGNPNADLMFVGEAPGRDEDMQGEPFVGRAGKLLDKLLAEIGLDRSKYFIANILKCRPPQNRDPNPAEIMHCMPYLERQIELVKPKIIVALGRISAQRLLEIDTPIGKMRGQTFIYRDTDFTVLYHPAALLRNPNLMDTTRSDIRNIYEKYLR